MKRAPKIGDRVSYPGGLTVGACVGVVTRIYPQDLWPDDFYDDPDAEAGVTHKPLGLAPESDWHVAMKPDALPAQWPYPGSDTFAPCVSDLRKVTK